MTTTILQDMGIFLKTFTRKRSDRKPDHFMDFEEEGELEMSDQGVYEDREQFDELHMNDVSAYEDGTPRGGDVSPNNDGQQVYESMQDVLPADQNREDNRYTLG